MMLPGTSSVETLDHDQCPFCYPLEGDDQLSSVCPWHRLLLFCRIIGFLVRTRQSRRIWRTKR